MDLITSDDNKLFKRACKLKDKKYRDECGEYLIEGLRGISDTPAGLIKTVFVKEGGADIAPGKTVYLTEKLIKKLSLTESGHDAVAIAAKKPEEDFAGDYIVYLDRIRDPGNMGTVIRTAVASGYEVVCDDCVDVYNPKVVRSCVSALSKAKLHIGNFIDIIAKKGYNIIGASTDGRYVFDMDKPQKICIVIGNEANGISEEISAKCNDFCSIPMQNMESLNASVCAGILMYYFKY